MFDNLFDDLDMDELDNIIELNDEHGKAIKFEFLDLVEFKNEEYVVLLPTDDNADEVVILKVDNDENSEEESYVSVEDQNTLDAVIQVFKEKFKDEFNFAE